MKGPRTFTTERRNLSGPSSRERIQADMDRELAEMREESVARQLERATREFEARTVPKYDYQRRNMTPIEFAGHVLRDQGLLHLHHRHEWLDGQYATPARKIEHANAALARLGLQPVAMVKRV